MSFQACFLKKGYSGLYIFISKIDGIMANLGGSKTVVNNYITFGANVPPQHDTIA